MANAPSVKIRLPTGGSPSTGGLWNISLGGVFIEMGEPLAFGVEMQLEFSVPSQHRNIRCEGFVVWSTRSSPDRARGMQGIAVRLMNLGIAEMRIIADSVARNLER